MVLTFEVVVTAKNDQLTSDCGHDGMAEIVVAELLRLTSLPWVIDVAIRELHSPLETRATRGHVGP